MSSIYDNLAACYETPANRLFYETIASELLAASTAACSQSPRSILEVGCGTGLATRLLSDSFPSADIIACDPSSDMLQVAGRKDLPANVRFVNLPVESLQVSPRSFVFSSMCLHWLSPEALHHLADMVEPGGTAAFSLPLADPLSRMSANRMLMHTLKELRREVGGDRAPGAYVSRLDSRIRPFRLIEYRTISLTEEFTDSVVLSNTLLSRGVMDAVFGEAAGRAARMIAEAERRDLRMSWRIALLTAQLTQEKASSTGE